MRPNRIGWGIVAFFFIGGIAFVLTIPEIYIGQIWITVALVLAGVYVWMNIRSDKLAELQATGTPGKATILEMTQTGTYINEMPRVRLKLRIEGAGIEPYELEKTMTVPHVALGALSGGTPLNVFIDPSNKQEISIDWFGQTPRGPVTISRDDGSFVSVKDPTAQQAVLQVLQQHGVDPTAGSADLRQMPAVREAVFDTLRKHGIDVDRQADMNDRTASLDQTDDPTERLTKLSALRSENLISQEEFEEHRARILEDI